MAKKKISAFAVGQRAHSARLDHWKGPQAKVASGGASQSPALLPRAERDGRADGHQGHKVGDGKSD